ncbi:hypothetical protein CsSME_00002599 [Camellia sinensis var. sinensis]
MRIPNIFKANNTLRPESSNPVRENLVHKPNPKHNGFKPSVFRLLRRLMSGNKIDGGSRTEEEDKVYSWLYALAQSEKDMVFEYVRSTERGECISNLLRVFFFFFKKKKNWWKCCLEGISLVNSVILI